MLQYASLAVALISLAYASYSDIKTRLVSNRLTYGMVLAGILIHTIESITSASPNPLIICLVATSLAFAFSYLLWQLGAWAGGDVKLFTGIAALLPFSPLASALPEFYATIPAFPFLILLNSILVSFPFIMLYVLWRTLASKSLRKHFTSMLKRTAIRGALLGLALFGFSTLLSHFALPQLFAFPLLILLAFARPPINYAVAAIASVAALILNPASTTSLITILAGSLLALLFFEAVTYGRKYALRTKKKVSSLEEGDIPAETIYLDRGKARVFKPANILASLFEPENVVVSSRWAGGVEKRDIAKLKRLGVRQLWVKESIPMVPIVLLGCIVSLFVGDLVWAATTALR